MILAGHDSINTTATDLRARRARTATAASTKIRGDWRETMSTHWFHDHMLDFTAQNVYKGNAAMANLYSAARSRQRRLPVPLRQSRQRQSVPAERHGARLG